LSQLHAVVAGTLPVVRHGLDLTWSSAPVLRHWGSVASGIGAVTVAAQPRHRGFVDTLWACLDAILGVTAFMKVLEAKDLVIADHVSGAHHPCVHESPSSHSP
jgi:hypothetical protein